MDAIAKTVTEIHPAPNRGADLPSAGLQQLWFACLRAPWSSLLVLPAHPEGSAHEIARALTEMGTMLRNRSVKFLDARGLSMNGSTRMILELTSNASAGDLTVICADSVLSNQAAVPVVLAADAVMLIVELGQAETELARRTVELVGPERFLGVVAVHPQPGPRK